MTGTHPLFKDTGVIILAGGKSERMGFPKPFLELDGELLLENLYRTYSQFTNKIQVVLNKEFCEGKWKGTYERLSFFIHIQQNPHPEYGRFFSLQLGLARMTGKGYCFIQNVDNPVSPDVILALARRKSPCGYTAPAIHGEGGHPILVSRTVMNAVLNAGPGAHILSDFLKSWPRTAVPVSEEKILVNLNTDEDFQNYLNLFST